MKPSSLEEIITTVVVTCVAQVTKGQTTECNKVICDEIEKRLEEANAESRESWMKNTARSMIVLTRSLQSTIIFRWSMDVPK